MLILKYHGNQNYCRPISGLFWREPMTKSHSFLDKLSFKVRICNFPWQQIKIFKFLFLYYTPWPWQIDHAKFRRDRLRNAGGDSRNICLDTKRVEVFTAGINCWQQCHTLTITDFMKTAWNLHEKCYIWEVQLKADRPHPRNYLQMPYWLQTNRQNPRFKQESSDRQTHKRTDGCYQLHYLPCFAVDNKESSIYAVPMAKFLEFKVPTI